MDELSHIDTQGDARMVDISGKIPTKRTATAEAQIRTNEVVRELLQTNTVPKGNVFATARVAGILAAKRTAELIPMCHTLPLSKVDIDLTITEYGVYIQATAICEAKTGVEMEAMTACAVAALTVYDMCKSADKSIEITNVRLLSKAGGKSGEWRRPDTEEAE